VPRKNSLCGAFAVERREEKPDRSFLLLLIKDKSDPGLG
jgi:hypothetical protein